MFKKILIANRGEIACRVAATAKRMGIQTVAVYSDADAHAKHVAACDEAIHVGGSAPKDSYLRWEAIIEAAKATGAQAIHPGYGFLSENEAFAEACAKAGLVFIGPPASAIQAMGLKAESKQLMEKAGVPLVPGYHGADQNPDLLKREADRIGYPVLIKASAGGGGKGMRAVEKSEDFADALASCQREAQNSFGDQAVLIEKYVQRPRHIEIQVFGDTQGNCVYLMERDCSVQRRHQKVLEEAPAPGLSEALRQQMGEAAVAAARAVNYVGAGTVEFIVEQRDNKSTGQVDMNFFFMEMNTRLQVEHPVTEAVTGLDLVEWQLRVASGQPLPLKQDEIKLTGHAIEARICAETPDNNFLPATGHLQVYQKPVHTAFERGTVRFDDGVRQGDTISPYYDSMVAKLIVHGDTREQALALLDQALAQTQVVGLSTNVQFLRHVVSSASFAEARLDTALIPREADALFNQEKLGLNVAAAAVVAHTLHQENSQQGNDPFSKSDGWQSHAETNRRFPLEFAGENHVAWLRYAHGGSMYLTWGDAAGPGVQSDADAFEFSVAGNASHTKSTALNVTWQGQRVISQVVMQLGKPGQPAELAHVFAAHGASRIRLINPLAHAEGAQDEKGGLTAPMPGKVVSFAVKVGDKVKAGQSLAVMEAMKMEHTIVAPKDGEVKELLYAPGDQIAEGAELLKLA
ncbi:acetyl/propionyl/methylcrotonyl-CoA carboxylase subunit alpha [Limnohabitans sp. Rim11]|uniref:acetyl-CoA carboxylase biotin carboxylase subunit n=1 Tax=Limnohabitans sp. Rim11 TaxID=1100719 RepID=UPI000A598AA5|nr:acetyl/propionyl/methylcrotonyl-CoA carboxylase subunit alpha [Limnohabitans sp. Rim11]